MPGEKLKSPGRLLGKGDADSRGACIEEQGIGSGPGNNYTHLCHARQYPPNQLILFRDQRTKGPDKGGKNTTAAESLKLTKIIAMGMSPVVVEPGLKPNQTCQRIHTPIVAIEMLYPGFAQITL